MREVRSAQKMQIRLLVSFLIFSRARKPSITQAATTKDIFNSNV
jgi:hypothetical protein